MTITKREWQAWLEAGYALTPERKATIIDEVCAGHPDRAAALRKLLAGIPPRDPGEEG